MVGFALLPTKGEYCTLLQFLLLLCAGNVFECISQKCKQSYPFIEITTNAVRKIGSQHDMFRDIDYYIVNPEATQLTINCSSTDPILWKIQLGKEYKGAKFDFYAEAVEGKGIPEETKEDGDLDNSSYNKTINSVCQTVSITFLDINENITGLYKCKNIQTTELYDEIGPPLFEDKMPEIYILGGKANSKEALINGGLDSQQIIFNTKEGIGNDYLLPIPCLLSYPNAIELKLKTKNGSNEELIPYEPSAFEEWCYKKIYPCINFEYVSQKYGNASTLLWKKGMKINCSPKNSNDSKVSVNVNFIPLLETKFVPAAKEMTLEVGYTQAIIFSCLSKRPVKMSTDFAFVSKVTISRHTDFYYTYVAKLNMTIPEQGNPDYQMVINVTVYCQSDEDQDQNHEAKFEHIWKYTLVNTDNFTRRPKQENGTLIISRPPINPGNVENRRIESGVDANNDPCFLCVSTVPEMLTLYFVPCSTISECQMKGPLLYDDEAIITDSHSIGHGVVSFNLPMNKSGMVRCVDFELDIMDYVYMPVKDDDIVIGSLLNSQRDRSYSDENDDELVTDLVISSNATEIFEGSVISVNCTTPLLLAVDLPYWEFKYRNNSEILLPDIILSSSTSANKEFLVVFAEIIVPNINIIGISCFNTQFETLSQIKWIQKMPVDNADRFTTIKRKETVPINVKSRPKSNSFFHNTGNTVGTIFGLLFIISSGMAIVVFHHYRKSKKFIREKLGESEIEYFINGRPEMISDSSNANENAKNASYDSSNEIDYNDLQIDFGTVLGMGEFGLVFKGVLQNDPTQVVAVKTLKPGACVSYLRAAMAELKVMLFIKEHENIVKIIGACTKDLINHKLLVVLEFCPGGNLLSYLRANSASFLNLVQDGKFDQTLSLGFGNGYVALLNTKDLCNWALQICNGMKYISSLNVIHGDLACRNILLDENLIAKISDFGLSKKLYELSHYTRNKGIPVPWCWLAEECLTLQEFSLASDVWSFGVTLWEIFSLGARPYPGLEYGPEFITMLTSGFRMALPQFATYEIYDIMLNCWRKYRSTRPTFDYLRSQFISMCQNINSEDQNGAKLPQNTLPSILPTNYTLYHSY